MKRQFEQLDAFVLHSRPYRENSLLVEFYSKEQGRFSGIARSKRQKGNHLYQLFCPLKISAFGKSDLLTVKSAEANGVPYFLTGQAQICGFYLHELLMYTTERFDPHPELFDSYQSCLIDMVQNQNLPKALRIFEMQLLEALGYGINLDADAIYHEPLDEKDYYYYEDQRGFVKLGGDKLQADQQRCFSGVFLKKLMTLNLIEAEDLSAAKRLTRYALAPLLNGREIKSRELLR